jgi:hypothetical protein
MPGSWPLLPAIESPKSLVRQPPPQGLRQARINSRTKLARALPPEPGRTPFCPRGRALGLGDSGMRAVAGRGDDGRRDRRREGRSRSARASSCSSLEPTYSTASGCGASDDVAMPASSSTPRSRCSRPGAYSETILSWKPAFRDAPAIRSQGRAGSTPSPRTSCSP